MAGSRRYTDLPRSCCCSVSAGRNVTNRSAEAMTIFAVVCAGLFPLFHTGRPWLDSLDASKAESVRSPWWTSIRLSLGRICDLYLLPYLWYSGISVYCLTWVQCVTVVWILPRDSSTITFYLVGKVQRDWHRFEEVSFVLAGLSTPLCTFFCTHHRILWLRDSIVPGWHTTIFLPLFRCWCDFLRLRDGVDPDDHCQKSIESGRVHHDQSIELMNKIIILTGSIVGAAYITEFFIACSEFSMNQCVPKPCFRSVLVGILDMMTCNVITLTELVQKSVPA